VPERHVGRGDGHGRERAPRADLTNDVGGPRSPVLLLRRQRRGRGGEPSHSNCKATHSPAGRSPAGRGPRAPTRICAHHAVDYIFRRRSGRRCVPIWTVYALATPLIRPTSPISGWLSPSVATVCADGPVNGVQGATRSSLVNGAFCHATADEWIRSLIAGVVCMARQRAESLGTRHPSHVVAAQHGSPRTKMTTRCSVLT